MPRPTPELQREYQRLHVARVRAEFFAGKRCARCGSSEKLQLHHRIPAQKISHNVWSWTPERRIAEIGKCEILCKSCHVEHHAAERRRHGTRRRYEAGCRCEPCRHAKSLENARYRARKLARAQPPRRLPPVPLSLKAGG